MFLIFVLNKSSIIQSFARPYSESKQEVSNVFLFTSRKLKSQHIKGTLTPISSINVGVTVCTRVISHLWMSCCVFCIDVMEASISAMSFTSLLHRAHWFENPAHTTDENIRLQTAFCERNCVCLSVCVHLTFIVR